MLATLGVIWVGAIKAVQVVLVLLRFVQATSRPRVEILGEVAGLSGFHALTRHPEARTEPDLALFPFHARFFLTLRRTVKVYRAMQSPVPADESGV